MIDRETRRAYEARAETDGSYAIALALHGVEEALLNLGYGAGRNPGPDHHPESAQGVIEGGFMHLGDAIKQAAGELADAIRDKDG